jgi:hypothetical protein
LSRSAGGRAGARRPQPSTISKERSSTLAWLSKDLNGKSFYYQLRNRILNLDEYFRSLENLVKAQVFNPQKRHPWTLEDATERWEEVKKQAQEDKQKCELVRKLPEHEKQLQELQKNATTSSAAESEKKE